MGFINSVAYVQRQIDAVIYSICAVDLPESILTTMLYYCC